MTARQKQQGPQQTSEKTQASCEMETDEVTVTDCDTESDTDVLGELSAHARSVSMQTDLTIDNIKG